MLQHVFVTVFKKIRYLWMTLLSQLSLISWSSQQKHYLFTAMLIRIKSWQIWNGKSCEIVPDMKISCCKVWLNSANFPSKDGGSNQNAKPNKKLFNNLLMMILFGIIYGFSWIQICDFYDGLMTFSRSFGIRIYEFFLILNI